MYRSLGDLVAGWSKNMFMGGVQAFHPWLRPFVLPVSLLGACLFWLAPAVALVVACVGLATGAGGAAAWAVWAATVCAVSALTLGWFTSRMGAPAPYGLLYPLGAVAVIYILARSYRRGRNVEWKGRRYTLPPSTERP
jgi:hypothetical protein